MCKSFGALQAIIRASMHLDPLSGYLFVFKNKRADRIKCVYWERDRFCMFYKVLQKGTFQFPDLEHITSAGLEIDPSTMRMILDGVDLSSIKGRQRYQLPQISQHAGEFVGSGIAFLLRLLAALPGKFPLSQLTVFARYC